MFENPERVKKYDYIIRISYELTNAYEYGFLCSRKPHTINTCYDIHSYNQYKDFDISNPTNTKTLKLMEEYKTKFSNPKYIEQRFHVKDTFYSKKKTVFCFNLFDFVERYYVCDLKDIKLTQVEIIVDTITPLSEVTPKELFSQLDVPSYIQLMQYYVNLTKGTLKTTKESKKVKEPKEPKKSKKDNTTESTQSIQPTEQSNIKVETSTVSINNDKIKIIRATSPKTLTKKKK